MQSPQTSPCLSLRTAYKVYGVAADLATLALAAPLPLLFAMCVKSNFNPTPAQFDKSKHTVVLLHGNGCSEFQFGFARLFLKQFNVYTLNLDGFVTNQASMGINNYAERLGALIRTITETAGCKEFDLLGHSMGGFVSAYYDVNLAQKDGIRIRSVVCLSTPWKGSPPLEFLATHLSSFCDPVRYVQMRNIQGFIDTLAEKVSKSAGKYFFICCKADNIAPPERAVLDCAKPENVQTFIAGHYNSMLHPPLWSQVASWWK